MAGIKVRGRYCISLPGLLKWIQMIFAGVVLGLLLWEAIKAQDAGSRFLLQGEEYTCIVAVVCIVVNFIFLIIFFLNCHMGPCVSCRCFTFASFYYGLSVLMWLAAGGVEAYATVQFRDRKTTDLGIFGKINAQTERDEELYHRRAAAAAFCFANALLYIVSLQQAKYQDL